MKFQAGHIDLKEHHSQSFPGVAGKESAFHAPTMRSHRPRSSVFVSAKSSRRRRMDMTVGPSAREEGKERGRQKRERAATDFRAAWRNIPPSLTFQTTRGNEDAIKTTKEGDWNKSGKMQRWRGRQLGRGRTEVDQLQSRGRPLFDLFEKESVHFKLKELVVHDPFVHRVGIFEGRSLSCHGEMEWARGQGEQMRRRGRGQRRAFGGGSTEKDLKEEKARHTAHAGM